MNVQELTGENNDFKQTAEAVLEWKALNFSKLIQHILN